MEFKKSLEKIVLSNRVFSFQYPNEQLILTPPVLGSIFTTSFGCD
ncbi:hypothetical protein E2C01_045707 [Portunus trituberculatus]|uniref:Uncharacterized protein n=1 Tax=Portunus trituberculatus TaxID=210409 RepID=A0A5B7G3Q4_PORTR|nr:hypothetical protein [Portunus trituberculatus]